MKTNNKKFPLLWRGLGRGLIITAILLFSCTTTKQETNTDVLKYVNPFIGTDGHGHTYPGATSPFGMVQLSPDTRLEGWDGCSGYHYTDSVIYGFSHTHLSGTGVADYADVLLMPISGKAVYNNTEYSSSFSHNNETAEAGYYSVKLDKHNIFAELTTTPRTGFHNYNFAQTNDNKVILDLNHRDKVLDAFIHLVNDSTIEGYRISSAWAEKQFVYFYMEFSQKIDTLKVKTDGKIITTNNLKSTDIVASIQFNKLADKNLKIRVGLSAVDLQGAKNNLYNENQTWDFNKIKNENQDRWRKELNKFEITDNNKAKKTAFFTAVYHNFVVPNLFSDVDGKYRGMDQEIHYFETDQYTVFSLWDTYRATHPLYTIVQTEKTGNFIKTMLNQYKTGGILPIWELASNYTGCMIGYHSIPVITDAYFKGLTNIPVDTLLEMMLTSANQDHRGLEAYKNKGYIAINDDSESISKTLEYAYDDWCIAQVAKEAGKDSIYNRFIERAQSYKNIFDKQTNCMRPKLNGIWKEPFDPSEVDFNFTEANSWQYSFYVPQDIYTLRNLMGGNDKFEKQLDDLFSASTETKGRTQSDITGLIGQYAHGNEPSHHMAYLYNFVNKPEKTQKYVQRIIDELYTDQPNGLCGNEDCGQMSAWYVFSCMGFYPVNPANGEYVFGKPQFDELKINLENGKQFIIEKTGDKSANAIVKEIMLNGKKYTKAYINHSNIVQGGKLTFVMDKNESISFSNKDLPTSLISDNIIVTLPSFIGTKRTFTDSTIVNIVAENDAKIFYTLNSSDEKEFAKPFAIYDNATITIRAEKGDKSSKILTAKFYKIPEGRKITIKNKYQDQYAAGGINALIDGLTGSKNFRTGSWQGYYFEDLDAVIDLGESKRLTKLSINCIQDARSWIWMPEYVEFWVSTDNKYFAPVGKVKNDIDKLDYDVKIKTFSTQFYPKEVKYVKVFAKNHNICPPTHLGAGNKGYIFADEISFE